MRCAVSPVSTNGLDLCEGLVLEAPLSVIDRFRGFEGETLTAHIVILVTLRILDSYSKCLQPRPMEMKEQ